MGQRPAWPHKPGPAGATPASGTVLRQGLQCKGERTWSAKSAGRALLLVQAFGVVSTRKRQRTYPVNRWWTATGNPARPAGHERIVEVGLNPARLFFETDSIGRPQPDETYIPPGDVRRPTEHPWAGYFIGMMTMSEAYDQRWKHCEIHLNPETGEMHGDGDLDVLSWIQERLREEEKSWTRMTQSLGLDTTE